MKQEDDNFKNLDLSSLANRDYKEIGLTGKRPAGDWGRSRAEGMS